MMIGSIKHAEFQSFIANRNIVILAGGVGGAKLVDGFAQLFPAGDESPGSLTIIVNTGDDFRHMGLTVCPDLDTVTYTLAGEANPDTGWGRSGESWRTFSELQRLGGPDWFRLGDLDLATHLTRSHLLAKGHTLTEATRHLCRYFDIPHTVLPMSDQPAPTLVETDEGLLPFQTWFVEKQWQPEAKAIHLPEDVRATPQVLRALEEADLVTIAPSNPFVSIDPILNVYPIRAMVADLAEAVMAVSPIIAGAAVKGPAGKMMRDRGMAVTPQAIVDYFTDLIDVFVYDVRDEGTVSHDHAALLCTDTLMQDRADRVRLAREMLTYTLELLKL